MNYPYRECGCGKQIHVGGRSLCDDCMARPALSGGDLTATVDETLAYMRSLIREAEIEAHQDCRRYEDEARDRCHDRMRRLDAETVPMRRQIDHIVSLKAQAEMAKPIIFSPAPKN